MGFEEICEKIGNLAKDSNRSIQNYMMRSIILKTWVTTVMVLAAFTGFSQQTTVDLSTPLAIDPNVRIGKLDNGFVYYIRRNSKPEKRVELRLVVNAGSILETDDQQGLAHFMEHMNFNGTRTFPKNELLDFLQKTGVRFGGDINAYTSFDETVYMLQLPTDDTALVSKGYQVLLDWSHFALLDDKEIDKERGVITEEWRLGLGANDRMMKKIFPVIFKDSRYATRIPIGKIDIIRDFRHESLRSFYHDWYRPDLQAVVIVGDIDVDRTEAKIREAFGVLKNPPEAKERIVYDIPDNVDPLIAITTDKEAMSNNVIVFYKHPLRPDKTLGDFRESLLGELYTGMLNNRLGEIAQKPDAPFVHASPEYGTFLARTTDAYVINAVSKENRVDETLELLLAENERVKRFGFTQTEFDRQKEEIYSELEKAAKESDKTESLELSSEYVSNFLSQTAIPGAQKEFKYFKLLLPGLKLGEVNDLAKKWVTDNNLGIVVMAPEKENLRVPAEADVLSIIKRSKTASLQPYVDNFREEALITGTIKPGKITARKVNQELGCTELTLSNGITVVLKPTQFKNDEILFSGYSPGGKSLYPDSQYMSANYAAQIVDMSGAGNFDNVELEKKLKGRDLQVSPYIQELKEGFTGKSTPKDFETMLQLVYLYFGQPRKDSTAFRAFMSQMETQMKFMKSSPMVSFYDTLYKTVYPGYKRKLIFPSPVDLKEVNHDLAYQIYRERFADAGDFKFFLVGNFAVDTIAPLIERYFGSLPALNRKETWKDNSPKIFKGETNLFYHKGTDPQGMVGLVMEENIDWNEKMLLDINLFKEILSIKLIEVIREKMSGVYSPQVLAQVEQYPFSHFDLVVMYGCSPNATEKITKAVFGEIKKLRKNGPSLVDLNKARETMIRTRETDLEKNDFWLKKLESVYYNNDSPNSVNTFRDRINAVTVGEMKQFAEKHVNPGHYVRVVLVPEKK